MSVPSYTLYSDWELVEDIVEYEYRNKITAYVSDRIVVIKTPQRRHVRSKTYEATISDKFNTDEIPAPTYLEGNTNEFDSYNPEGLSPIGNDANKWHCDNVTYTKELSVPVSRHVRVTWVMNGVWTKYDESESM